MQKRVKKNAFFAVCLFFSTFFVFSLFFFVFTILRRNEHCSWVSSLFFGSFFENLIPNFAWRTIDVRRMNKKFKKWALDVLFF